MVSAVSLFAAIAIVAGQFSSGLATEMAETSHLDRTVQKRAGTPSSAALTEPAANPLVPEGCKHLGLAAKSRRLVTGAFKKVGAPKVGQVGLRLFAPMIDVGGILTDAVACRLNPAEQKQAAAATDAALQRETVGSLVSWTSASRPGVSGSSRITAIAVATPVQRCLLVTDVVIIEGEEARVEKRMCKAPGAARYVIAV